MLSDVIANAKDYENNLRKEGENSKASEMAKKMLLKNKPIAEIMEFTGLSEKEVKKIKKLYSNKNRLPQRKPDNYYLRYSALKKLLHLHSIYTFSEKRAKRVILRYSPIYLAYRLKSPKTTDSTDKNIGIR